MSYIKRLVAGIALCIAVNCHADTAVANGIEWTYRISGGKAEIYKGDGVAAIPASTAGIVTIPSMLGGYLVASIGDYAFADRDSLVEVRIPDTVLNIGHYAFGSCYGLENVVIGASVTNVGDQAFWNCVNLTNVIVGARVSTIAYYAFGHTGLLDVTLPDSAVDIDSTAFHNCTSLGEIRLPAMIADLKGSFAGNTSLTNVIIDPANPYYIFEDGAIFTKDHTELVWCSSVADVPSILASIEKIGEGAWDGCLSLFDVQIPDNVKSIDRFAFSSCDNLSSVVIGASVTNVGAQAFAFCRNLTNVTFGTNWRTIDWRTFERTGLYEITIPESVIAINGYAFANCDNLIRVNMPESLEGHFDSSVFNGCSPDLQIIYYDGGTPPEPVTAPSNDNFVDAYDFDVASGWYGSNVGATAEAGEPLTNHWGSATATVWYKWTAPGNGTATFDTVGSSFDTVMGVYTGTALGNLSVVAEDDDGGGSNNTSAATFQATEGTTYYIAVSGWNGTTGDILLNRTFEPDQSPGNSLPDPVTDLQATSDGPGIIRVSWDVSVSSIATGYKVFRATRNDFARAVLVAELSDGYALSFDDEDVSVDPTYYYWVVAVNDIGESAATGPVTGYCEEPLQITTATLPGATELVDYEQQLSVNLDNGNLGWYVECDENGNSGMPDGMDLSAEGVLSGFPTQYGTYSFTVSCIDTRFGISTSKELTLTVAENANRKPAVSTATPTNGTDVALSGGQSQLFSVMASDPEGVGLSYEWYVDGEPVQTGTKSNYRLRTVAEDAGMEHEVVCYVNDDLWTNIVNCSWRVYVTRDIYVDAASGNDDENDGLSANSAFASLDRAVGSVSPYDTIHVAPGTYDGGWLSVWCPVRLIATDGPAVTIIEGYDREEAIIQNDADVLWYSGKLEMQGFTLRNGLTAVSHAVLRRCVITCCGAESAPTPYFGSGEADAIAVLDDCVLERCTVAGNVTGADVALMENCTHDATTIVWGNGSDCDDAVDPRLVDAANGDCRLRTGSPYVVAGQATRGALDGVVDGFVISVRTVGPGTLDKMTAIVAQGGGVTFTVVAGSHSLDHFEVDGVTISSAGNSYVFANVRADAILTAVFVSNVTFYVDAVNGNDAADGLSRAAAVATLQVAIDRAVDGDEICVADGTYMPISTDGKHIVIESENGYGAAVIDGGGTNGCVYAGGRFYGDWSNTNTVLRGFTLVNGYASFGAGCIGGTIDQCLITGCTAYWQEPTYTHPYGVGGGAYGAFLRWCTIVGNTAEDGYTESSGDSGGSGGGAYGCVLERCIVWDNAATYVPDVDASDCLVCCLEDPVFADYDAGDYRLSAMSPWVSGGTAIVGCERRVAAAAESPDLPYRPDSPYYPSFVVWAHEWGLLSTAEMANEATVASRATATGVKGYPVWQDFVSGVDPTDEQARFRATISIDGGNVQVGWDPQLPAEEEARRIYTIYGSAELPRTNSEWVPIANIGDWSGYKYFKVRVDMLDAARAGAVVPDMFVLIFDANDGGDGTVRMIDSGQRVGSLPEPSRVGHEFNGWYTAETGGTRITASTTVSGSSIQTMYAHWSPIAYTVTFNANGGGADSTRTVSYGQALGSLPTPVREEFSFDGWYTAATGGLRVSEDTVITSEQTFYAHWTRATYCVIDLSGGSSATHYPITYLNEPPAGGFNTDEYKTSKLVLRLIPAGSFKLGGTNEVTVSKSFYIGIFEMTQRQYELVTGTTPSVHEGAMRPVENVSWVDVRGNEDTADWTTVEIITPTSFLGKINAKTGFECDLPTYVQWEYACRAGTTSTFNNGGGSEADMQQLGRYSANTNDGMGGYSEHTVVGSYLPNAWGLYDMHGNVWELALKKSDDPKIPGDEPSGNYSVSRGGAWGSTWGGCGSRVMITDRWVHKPGDATGFRLLRSVEQ